MNGSGGSGGVAQLPFSAVVGLDEAKLALILTAIDRRIGGVLLRGEKGSAKSTLARGLAALLPGDAPFVELPVGASEDRLVGTLDLTAALRAGEQRFAPGLLAAADGGVLYVDEINLLPDHLVDVLLDVAASGVNRVEREGISHVHPSRFLLIGSMNPEEGDLRPQLLDRFGLAVEVRASTDPAARAAAVRQRLYFDEDPRAVAAGVAGQEAALAERLAGATPATLSDGLISSVSSLCAALGAEGLRADLTICRAAAALAGWERRPAAMAEDVRRVAPLALAHRARRDPLEPAGMDADRLARALDQHVGGPGDAEYPAAGRQLAGLGGHAPHDRPVSEAATAAPGPDGSAPPPGADWSLPLGADGSAPPPRADGPLPLGADAPALPSAVDRPAPPLGGDATASSLGADAPARVSPPAVADARLATARLSASGASGRQPPSPSAGRRSLAEAPRGRLVGDRPPADPTGSIAIGATVRRAAARAVVEGPPPAGASLVVPADVRDAVRIQRSASLIVLAVNASGSMGAPQRMEAAKGTVLGLLTDAYQRRDLVGLVAFRGDGAQVLLRPTGSVEVAHARLAVLPTGGRTPLAAGIATALELATASGRAATHRPLLVLVTDGRATSAPAGRDPVDAAAAAADSVRLAGVEAVVIDVEGSGAPAGFARLGLARQLAGRMGARHIPVATLHADGLRRAIREH